MNIKNLSSITRLPVGTISRRRFFFEEQLPETARNLHHVYTPLKPVSCHFPKDVLGQTSPFAASFVRTNKDRYRFYGTSYDSGPTTMGISVWESSDGLHWTSRNTEMPLKSEGFLKIKRVTKWGLYERKRTVAGGF